VLFIGGVRTEQKADRCTGGVSAVMWILYGCQRIVLSRAWASGQGAFRTSSKEGLGMSPQVEASGTGG